jgi:hypothetical protein
MTAIISRYFAGVARATLPGVENTSCKPRAVFNASLVVFASTQQTYTHFPAAERTSMLNLVFLSPIAASLTNDSSKAFCVAQTQIDNDGGLLLLFVNAIVKQELNWLVSICVI